MSSDRRQADPEQNTAAQVSLPELEPRRSRQQWARSSLAAIDGGVVVGTGHGRVRAIDPDGTERWRCDLGEMVVSLEPTAGDAVLAGMRGETARIALLDAATGAVRWQYDLAEDLGHATEETLFYYPMTADLASDPAGGRTYAAARRYERPEGDRRFESVVYAFEPDGTLAWRYEADASPIGLARRDDRLAVAYNRCSGDHRSGLVVLDANSGTERLRWDPPADGDRRIGDVALDSGGVVAASHTDYRGYALDERGCERWAVDLGTPTDVGGETVYTYPTRVVGDADGTYFITGNTFPAAGRATDARHPREHTLVAVEGGEVDWTAPVGGWAGDLAADGGGLAVACAQHFRDRDPATHALRAFDQETGAVREWALDGIGAVVARVGDRIAILEEPIEYHDEGEVRGTHRLHLLDA